MGNPWGVEFVRFHDLVVDTVSYPDKYHRLLMDLASDRAVSEGVLLGLAKAPAAKANHHAQCGGLVLHMQEMWEFWKLLQGGLPPSEELSDDLVLRAIVHHDLEKAWECYLLVSEDPWKVEYYRGPSMTLMRGDARSLYLLGLYEIPVTPILVNALMNSHGGFTKDPSPVVCLLAKLAYLLDELSGNVLDRLRTGFLTVRRV